QREMASEGGTVDLKDKPVDPAVLKNFAPRPVPDHVPPHLLIDATQYLPRLTAELDPYGSTQGMLEKLPPIFYSDKMGMGRVWDSAWVVTRNKEIRGVLQNDALYSVADSVHMHKLIGETFPMIPLGVDPPDHTKYRAFLNPRFSPRAMDALEGHMRATIGELI